MLDHLFRPLRRSLILSRIRANRLGREIEDFAGYLGGLGYALAAQHQYLQAIEHLGTWMRLRRIPTEHLHEDAIAKFIGHLAGCSCPRPASCDLKVLRAATRRFLRHLREQGRVAQRLPRTVSSVDREIEQFDRHLLETCGLAHNTRIYSRRYVRQFLSRKFGRGSVEPAKIRPRDVMEFVADQAALWKPGTAKVIVCSLRGYFRYLQLRGLCDTRLVSAVPTIPIWKLDSIPKSIGPEDLRRFLSSFDRSTPVGRRDYAMALCMVDCGLRVCEVGDLRLNDLDWRQATLRVPGRKTRRSRLLPLTARVGKAIASYLRNGRPSSRDRGLFIIHKAPWSQATACTVRGAMRSAYDRSGAAPWSGPHALRHTLAARMVTRGARIKEVADVLGHTSIDTTSIYAKVNLPMLESVALPWPGRVQS